MSVNNYRILHSSISLEELKNIKGLHIPGIYKIENIITHKVYIGQSLDVVTRLKSHLRKEDNPYLNKAFKKYGLDNFSFEILKETYDVNYWEVFLIQIYHATDKQYGYNIQSGGEGGNSEATRKQWESSEMRKKMSISRNKYWASEKGRQQKRLNSEFMKTFCPKPTLGKRWYTNGTEDILADECPEGFTLGRCKTQVPCSEETKQKKRDWWINLSEEEKKAHLEKVSSGLKGHGCSDTCRSNISKANKGRHYYNNGVIEVMQFECPEGFVPGRLPSMAAKISKNLKRKQISIINNRGIL